MAAVSLDSRPRRRLGDGWLALLLLVVCLVLAVSPAVVDSGELSLWSEILLVIAMSQMWNLLAGYAGLMSIGHQAFVGIGAYALFAFSNFTGANPYLSLIVAPVLCAAVAAAIAPFLFRLRDAYFSIGMWVFAEIVVILVGKSTVLGREYGMPLKQVGRLSQDWFAPIIYWGAAVLAVGTTLLVFVLLRSRLGLGLMAVRDNDLTAGGLGIDVWRSRLVAFVISAAGCGLAGAIYFMAAYQVVPGSAFDDNWVIEMLFISIIGGLGTIEGPIVGAVIYFGLRELFSEAGNWYLIIVGIVAIAVMLAAPRGIWGSFSARFGIELFSVRRRPPRRAAR